MDDFEKTLMEMSKPKLTRLRHQEILSKELFMNRHRNAVSWWWLGIPLYIVTALVMKSVYSPTGSLEAGIRQLKNHNKSLTYLAFVVVPVLLILINAVNLFKIGRMIKTRDLYFLKAIQVNLIILVLSVVVLIIFLTM